MLQPNVLLFKHQMLQHANVGDVKERERERASKLVAGALARASVSSRNSGNART